MQIDARVLTNSERIDRNASGDAASLYTADRSRSSLMRPASWLKCLTASSRGALNMLGYPLIDEVSLTETIGHKACDKREYERNRDLKWDITLKITFEFCDPGPMKFLPFVHVFRWIQLSFNATSEWLCVVQPLNDADTSCHGNYLDSD